MGGSDTKTETYQAEEDEMFQSSPATMGGSDMAWDPCLPKTDRFNPLPPQWAGATECGPPEMPWHGEFQSSPATMGGSDRHQRARHALGQAVSILSRHNGRERRQAKRESADRPGSFNPLPPQWAGAT